MFLEQLLHPFILYLHLAYFLLKFLQLTCYSVLTVLALFRFIVQLLNFLNFWFFDGFILTILIICSKFRRQT